MLYKAIVPPTPHAVQDESDTPVIRQTERHKEYIFPADWLKMGIRRMFLGAWPLGESEGK